MRQCHVGDSPFALPERPDRFLGDQGAGHRPVTAVHDRPERAGWIPFELPRERCGGRGSRRHVSPTHLSVRHRTSLSGWMNRYPSNEHRKPPLSGIANLQFSAALATARGGCSGGKYGRRESCGGHFDVAAAGHQPSGGSHGFG